MIQLNILYKKYFSSDKNDKKIVDLTRTSIDSKKLANTQTVSSFLVRDEYQMRPDLIAKNLYNDHNMADLLMKYNAISNPFSLEEGKILISPSSEDLINLCKIPTPIKDIGDTSNRVDETEIFNKPKTDKDKKRLALLKEKNKGKDVLPSNLNKKGDKNIKIKNGKLVFGEDVTSVNKNDCPEPISRANLKKALIKNNLFG